MSQQSDTVECLLNRILIVDDHEVVRGGVRNLLTAASLDVCGEGANGQEAIEKYEQLRPDLIVLDLSMPVMSGLEAARKIRQRHPSAKILIFTMHDSSEVERQAKSAGADGLVVKSRASAELVSAVRRLLTAPATPA